MNAQYFIAMPGNDAMTSALAAKFACGAGRIEMRRFPDEESYVRVAGKVDGLRVALVCTLDRPDTKILPLVFALDAVRELGAASIGLVAPYLAYMRQDRRFEPGEAITSRSFARILSRSMDWLVTIDPHLHRYKSLGEIYSVPARVLHAAPLLAEWISGNISQPILVGPDQESRQWVSQAAAKIGAPFTVLEKTRKGDRVVDIRLTETNVFGDRKPVLVDDIVSSGETFIAAARCVRAVSSVPPICVAVHGLFAEGTLARFAQEDLQVVTTNTISNASNRIDVSGLLADGIAELSSAEA